MFIVLAGIAAYHNSLNGPFIFDDVQSIPENSTIRSLWPIWTVLSPPKEGQAVQRRPIVNLSLAVNYAVGGLDVRGYHVFNLVVHILAALALFAVIRRTLRLAVMPEHIAAASLPLAFAAALIWTVHPLATEAVTYIVQRTELLAGLFYLLTLYCLIRGASTSRAVWWYVAAVAACTLGMGSKEAVVSAPLVVLLYDRFFLCGSFKEVLRRRWLLYLALASSWALPAMLLVHGREATGGAYWATLHSYALAQLVAVVRYLGLCFWPYPLVMDYGELSPGEVPLPLPHAAVIVVLLAVTIWALCRRPRVGFLGVWFFAILAPSSSIVPLVAQPIAEKRMYLPLAAVVVVVVLGAYALGRRFRQGRGLPGGPHNVVGRVVGLALAGAIALALGIVTVRRNCDYSGGLSIWTDTVTKQPGNARAWNNQGVAHGRKGEHDAAIGDFTRAVELKPDYAEAYNNRGSARRQKGDHDKAIGDFTRAIELEPRSAQFHNNRGLAHGRKGDHDKAIDDFTRAIELEPDYAEAYNNRGFALGQKGDFDRAIADYDRAIALNPKFAKAFRNRGVAYDRKGNHDRAIRDFTRAIALNPDRPEAYCDRGIARDHKGDYDRAIRDYSKAIALDPKFAKAYHNRAVMYFHKRNYKSAWSDVNAAEALGYKVTPEFLDALRKVSARN